MGQKSSAPLSSKEGWKGGLIQFNGSKAMAVKD